MIRDNGIIRFATGDINRKSFARHLPESPWQGMFFHISGVSGAFWDHLVFRIW